MYSNYIVIPIGTFSWFATFGRGDIRGVYIAHVFTYYCLIFSLYYIYRRRYINAFLILILCILLGRRTTLFLALINLFILFRSYSNKYVRILGWSVALFFCFWGGMKLLPDIISNSGQDVSLKSYKIIDDGGESNAISNGRSVIWYYMMEELDRTPFLSVKSILGRGPMSSVEYNRQLTGNAIWMHNDFFDILFCLGYLGLVLYLVVMIAYSLKIHSFVFFLYFGVMGFFNGFMHYNGGLIVLMFLLV